MIRFIKNLLGLGQSVNYKQMVQDGALILDVRTKGEFDTGHIKGALNIPVQELGRHVSKLQKQRPVITCCASGMRSATAKSMLRSAGFAEVHNGGPWTSLQKKIL